MTTRKNPIISLFLFLRQKWTVFQLWFTKASKKKKAIVIGILLLILFFIIKSFSGNKKSSYTFDTVQKATISQLVTQTGNVIASNETDVFSPTTGVLDQVYVHNGDSVTQGDKLFTVRSTATAQEQAVAFANYENALSSEKSAEETQLSLQTQLEQARQQVISAATAVEQMDTNRNNSRVNPATNQAYTQNDIDAIQSALTSSRENFTTIEKKYNEAGIAIAAATASVTSTNLAYQATQNTTITAPTNGTISNIIGISGAKVVAQISSAATSSTSTTVTPVLIIGTTGSSAIQTTVSEVDVNKVAIGQKASILFSAIPNSSYTGHIIQTDTYGTNTNGVITYNVFISIDNPDQNIKPNMSANLTINTAKRNDTLTVANAAIVPYQGGKAVQVLDKKGTVVFLPVKVGLRGFTRTEILSGVQKGTRVIVGNTKLTNNAGALN